jgi:hypothetical protein
LGSATRLRHQLTLPPEPARNKTSFPFSTKENSSPGLAGLASRRCEVDVGRFLQDLYGFRVRWIRCLPFSALALTSKAGRMSIAVLAIKLYRTRGLNPRVRPKGRAAASPLWKPHRLCARLKRRG